MWIHFERAHDAVVWSTNQCENQEPTRSIQFWLWLKAFSHLSASIFMYTFNIKINRYHHLSPHLRERGHNARMLVYSDTVRYGICWQRVFTSKCDHNLISEIMNEHSDDRCDWKAPTTTTKKCFVHKSTHIVIWTERHTKNPLTRNTHPHQLDLTEWCGVDNLRDSIT